MHHQDVLPTTRDVDSGAVQHFLDGHGEFSLIKLGVAYSRLLRMRYTIAIRPGAWRRNNWTKVSATLSYQSVQRWRLHFRFHQRFGQPANSFAQRTAILLFEQPSNGRGGDLVGSA